MISLPAARFVSGAVLHLQPHILGDVTPEVDEVFTVEILHRGWAY